MSLDAMAAVWDHGPGDSIDRFVLLTIADRADAYGYCYPSYKDIYKRCAISRRTAIAAVGRLEAAGWLTRANHYRAGNRGQTSNSYYLNMARLGVEVPAADDSGRRPAGSDRTAPGGAANAPGGAANAPGGVIVPHPLNLQLESSSNPQVRKEEAEEPAAPAAATAALYERPPTEDEVKRLTGLGLGVNTKTLTLVRRPDFTDEYAEAMLGWAIREGKSTGLAITLMQRREPAPVPEPCHLCAVVHYDGRCTWWDHVIKS